MIKGLKVVLFWNFTTMPHSAGLTRCKVMLSMASVAVLATCAAQCRPWCQWMPGTQVLITNRVLSYLTNIMATGGKVIILYKVLLISPRLQHSWKPTWNPQMDAEELAFPFEKTILRLQPVVVRVGNGLNPCDKFCWDISASTCKLSFFRKRKSEIGHNSLEECPPNPLVSN